MIDPSFLRKRRPRWKFPLESFFLHFVILILMIIAERAYHYRKQNSQEAKDVEATKRALKVKPISEAEFRKMLPRDMIVDTEIVSPLDKKPKDQAKYLGEKTQRVKEESRAKDFGSSRGGQKTKAPPAKKDVPKLPGIGKPEKIGKELEPSEKSQLQRGNYNVLDSDVKVSAQTVLNTDEYIYASFYNRMRDTIAALWEPRVRDILENRYSKMNPGIYKTETRIFITRDGYVVDVKMEQGSGLKELDSIAVTSVLQARQFQNPPAQLFEKDPRAGLEFGFYVHIFPQNLLQFNYIPDDRLRQ